MLSLTSVAEWKELRFTRVTSGVSIPVAGDVFFFLFFFFFVFFFVFFFDFVFLLFFFGKEYYLNKFLFAECDACFLLIHATFMYLQTSCFHWSHLRAWDILLGVQDNKIYRGSSNFYHEYDFYFKKKDIYISWVAQPRMKYCYFFHLV